MKSQEKDNGIVIFLWKKSVLNAESCSNISLVTNWIKSWKKNWRDESMFHWIQMNSLIYKKVVNVMQKMIYKLISSWIELNIENIAWRIDFMIFKWTWIDFMSYLCNIFFNIHRIHSSWKIVMK